MKTKTKLKASKPVRAKARVVYSCKSFDSPERFPHVLIPFATAEQAKAFAQVLNMSDGERIVCAAKALAEYGKNWAEFVGDAKLVLTALGLQP